MKKKSGFIVIIAFPEVVVRTANGEMTSKIWPLFGVGGQQYVKAGHAALLLVSKKTNKINYYDFGRYITSNTFGRVRSVDTDNEVHIPFAADHNFEEILNLEEVLIYLEKHPQITHGEGRMIVSVNHEVDYDKALTYINNLQDEIEVPYGAFHKKASNCARFVTDTLIASTTNKKIRSRLKKSYVLTPSPISNVLRGGSENAIPLEVFNQKIRKYTNKYVLVEHKKCLFSKVSQETVDIGTILPDITKFNSQKGQWLGGIGSGAWFELFSIESNSDKFRIVRRNVIGISDLDAEFHLNVIGFDIEKPYAFQYGSNCKRCVVKQNETMFYFTRVLN